MNKKELEKRYFRWLCKFVRPPIYNKRKSYNTLLWYLYCTDFSYTIQNDDNRFSDGVDMRYRFGEEKNISASIISNVLDNRNCSILEMMVALSFRCENQIMEDYSVGNRTSYWFWKMIESLGLKGMSDENFDFYLPAVTQIIDNFLNRRYARNGSGGLFTVNTVDVDMRSIEIWYQMCLYLEEFERGETR